MPMYTVSICKTEEIEADSEDEAVQDFIDSIFDDDVHAECEEDNEEDEDEDDDEEKSDED